MRSIRLTLILLFLFMLPTQAQSLPTIDFFTVDNTALRYSAVELGIEAANFSWQASGLRAGDSMEMHAWVGGAWVLIGAGFEPIKTDRLVIAHPLSFELPRYRLSIVDSSGQRIVESFLDLNYAQPEALPSVNFFLARNYSTSPDVILNDEGIAVHWQVNNRWYRSNIVYEQVFSDGTVIAIADNVLTEWRRAWGEGVLHPEYTGEGRDIVLRLRVVNIDTNETLAQRDTVIPVINPEVPTAEVLSFTVNPSMGQRGGTATLTWNVANANRVFIGQRTPHQLSSNCSHNGGYSADIIYEELPPSGSLEIQIPAEAYGPLRFQLVADRYLTGAYSCEPSPLLEEIFLELDSYNSANPLIRQIGMNPSFTAVAGSIVRLNWDISAGESLIIVQGSGYGENSEQQRFEDLPLRGSLDITLPDTAQIRQDTYIWFSAYLVRAGLPEPEYLWSDSLSIDPDDNLACVSYLRTEPTMIVPVQPAQSITVAWDGCGAENLVLRMTLEDPDNNYNLLLEETQNVASSGSQTRTVPNQTGVLRFVLYRLLDGQEIELQRAGLVIEN